MKYIENLEINVSVKIKKGKSQNKKNKNENQVQIVRKSVLQSTVIRTGFVGLIICLKNFYCLCNMLFKEEICDYVLSYKLSQDHVEMFFALIRRMNGYTNNPTTI